MIFGYKLLYFALKLTLLPAPTSVKCPRPILQDTSSYFYNLYIACTSTCHLCPAIFSTFIQLKFWPKNFIQNYKMNQLLKKQDNISSWMFQSAWHHSWEKIAIPISYFEAQNLQSNDFPRGGWCLWTYLKLNIVVCISLKYGL